MKHWLTTAALAGLAAAATLSAHAADVGVSVHISQPGVYGRVDIGRFPQPQIVVAQPVIVQQPVYVQAPPQPVYMWVPPGHRKHWNQHCGQYNACGVPVYVVQDRWYDQRVRPHMHDERRDDDRRHDERRFDDRDEHGNNGNGHGYGKGKDKGKGKGKHDD